jgi:hypothetical protein
MNNYKNFKYKNITSPHNTVCYFMIQRILQKYKLDCVKPMQQKLHAATVIPNKQIKTLDLGYFS